MIATPATENVSLDANNHTAVLTLKQAAAYLQVSKAHLSNVLNGKVIGVTPVRCFRVGRRILFKREWVDDWMESANLDGRR